jgi:phosphate transport system permease protein
MIPRNLKDSAAQKIMFLLCIFVLSLVLVIALLLYFRARPVLALGSLGSILFSSAWHPTRGQFGLAGFIAGTLWVTGIAVILAVPLSIFTALYLSEYAHRTVRSMVSPVIDLLAGISPVVYGVWGVIAVVPLVRDYLMPFCVDNLPFPPFLSGNFTGFSALTGGIVLSVMILPIIISISQEVMAAVPAEVREASLALGATKWETIRSVVLRKAWPGIIAAVILGLSRAFGETMAVLMVAGCTLQELPRSVFDAAYPLPALIANTYGEMMSIPLYDSAVLLAAFMLMIVTALFNVAGWIILLRFERRDRV